jgi:hypothetical protein
MKKTTVNIFLFSCYLLVTVNCPEINKVRRHFARHGLYSNAPCGIDLTHSNWFAVLSSSNIRDNLESNCNNLQFVIIFKVIVTIYRTI